MVFTLHWGILGAGHISGVFVRDIILNPSTRGVDDVSHCLVAVGSRDTSKAQAFIDKNVEEANRGSVKACGSYEELINSEGVEAVYIGTPHTHHFDCAVLCLNAGKHVLVEKPATVNAPEWRALVELAQSKGLFLMEAMWTRFLPITLSIKKVIEGGELGDLRVLHADLAGDFDIDNIPTTHRILDPYLGGGALLDLGPYPLVWAIIAMYEAPKNNRAPPSRVTGSMIKTRTTGVDSSTTFVLDFQEIDAQAILSCSITIPAPPDALIMRFRQGNIVVPRPIYRPNKYIVQKFDKPGSDKIVHEETFEFASKLVGGGWHFQADEVARCIRDGKHQSEIWGLEKTLLQMEIFDEVRKQSGYKLPKGVEKVV